MNLNVFIAHSNKFMELASWFADFLKSRNLNPIIVESMPNYGRSWTIPEKVNYFLDICETALVIATPDELQDDDFIPRMDVNFEMGRLIYTKKIIFLKEENTKLPTGLSPVYISFSLDNPQDSLAHLDRELKSIFNDVVDFTQSYNVPPPKVRKAFDFGYEEKYEVSGKKLEISRAIKLNDTHIRGYILSKLYIGRYFVKLGKTTGRYIYINNIQKGLPIESRATINRNIEWLSRNNLIHVTKRDNRVSAILDKIQIERGLEICNKYRSLVGLPELDNRL